MQKCLKCGEGGRGRARAGNEVSEKRRTGSLLLSALRARDDWSIRRGVEVEVEVDRMEGRLFLTYPYCAYAVVRRTYPQGTFVPLGSSGLHSSVQISL